MASNTTSTSAFILSLIGGILILLGSGMTWMWVMFGGFDFGDMMNGFGHMMDGYPDMMDSFGIPSGFMTGLALVGVISGIVVIVGAIMLNARPATRMTWGTIIIVFSAISFIGMGGFWIGALLGIAGGSIALIWKPTTKH